MKTIDQIRAEGQVALDKQVAAHAEMLERAELFSTSGLPIPEYIASGNLWGAIGVSYRNDIHNGRTMANAVELFKLFDGKVVPFNCLKNGCTTLHPEKHIPASKGYKRDNYKNSDYAAALNVNHAGDSGHTSAALEFYANVGGKLLKVSIEFGAGYIGKCPKLAPVANISRGFRGSIEARTYNANTNAAALSDTILTYSYGDYGPIKSGADHRYLFVTDTADSDPAECTHALTQLENLAAIVDGASK
jgi:hypothetical protein